MQFAVTKIEPEPVYIRYDDLPREGWRKPSILRLSPLEVAFLGRDGRVEFHASEGDHVKEVEVNKGSDGYLSAREFDVTLDLNECSFVNGIGSVQIWTKMRFLSLEDMAHPVAVALCERRIKDRFIQVLERCLLICLEALFREFLAELRYEPGPNCCSIINRSLQGLGNRPELRKGLFSHVGMEIVADFVALQAGCNELDREYQQQKLDHEQTKRHQKELADKIRDISHEAALSDAKARAELQKQVHELEQQRIELQKKLEEHQAKVICAADELKLEAERKKLEREDAEIERQQTEADLAKQKKQNLERQSTLMDSLQEQLELVNQQIADLDGKIQSAAEVKRPLGMSVSWNAYRRGYGGIPMLIVPGIQSGCRLPSGTLLDVSVTVSEEAYVYILVKGSSGRWQRLVPDSEKIMGGITCSNQQRGGVEYGWPGENNNPCPPGEVNLPMWKLDDDAGWEHVLVIASIQELDLGKVVPDESKVRKLRSVAAPIMARGFTAAGSVAAGSERLRMGADVRDVRNCLVGDGCVIDELIIEHM